MNKTQIFLIASLLIFGACNQPVETDNRTSALTLDQRVDSVLVLMTLKEKIGQMNQYSTGSEMTGPNANTGNSKIRYDRFMKGEVGSVLNILGAEETYKLQKLVVEKTRLGIPLIFSFDVVHGYKTIFPLPLAESASWDLDMIKKSARIAADEATSAGLHWTFAPMVDITRDARWGRVMEGAGEDPYLGSEIAIARINGFQTNDLAANNSLAACAKHFAGYGFVEGGKDYNSTEIGNNTLHNVVLPPFKTAADVGVATFMNAFNDLDGVPSTANQLLVNHTLRDKWEYEGLVVSDWNSIGEIINWGVAKDSEAAAKLAIMAGCDIDMEADAYVNHLEDLVSDGQISVDLIDASVRRILKLKFKLGLFDDPYKYSDVEREKRTLLSKKNLEFAREIAASSIVLLKNEGELLPISNQRKIAVIGPLAKDKDSPLGNWRGAAVSNSAVSFYEGMQNVSDGKFELSYAEGCKLSIGPNTFFEELVIEEKDRSGFDEAISLAKESDLVFMVLGEPAYMSGEARSRSEIGLPGLQLELLKQVYSVNKNVVLVLMNGRPLAIPWEAEHIPAILETWHLGSEAGNAIADVITGKINPSGKLPMSFPRNVGQLPLYYNHLNTGRPESDQVFHVHQMDVDKTPQYPFGYGLSFTNFKYDNFSVTTNADSIYVEVEITNTGETKGYEVVQLYTRDLVASVARPVKELKAFRKFELAPGELKKINFSLFKKDLSFDNQLSEYLFEAGEFEISIGTNSNDLISKTVVYGK